METRRLFACALLAISANTVGAQGARRPLSSHDVDDIARLIMLEDHREFDTTDLSRILKSAHPEVRRRAAQSIGRIANKSGYALLRAKPLDADTAVAATEVWAAGQLKDSTTVAWFDSLLTSPTIAPTVLAEAATALGKIKTERARDALARFLSSATESARTTPAIEEALFSIGRCTTRGDNAPIAKFTTSENAEVRWRAAWALFRPRDPSAIRTIMNLTFDQSADVRMWAIRALTQPQADSAGQATDAERLVLAKVNDPDRRVRTEAIRTLGTYFRDVDALHALETAKASPDWWISSSAEEGLARANPPPPAPATGRGGGGGRGQRPVPPPNTRPLAEYKALVEKYVVPDYNGAKRPTAEWETPRGKFTIELYPGDAPLGVEEFVRIMESGSIVGTAFPRVVPNFVDQEETIPGAHRLRDEVTRRGLMRANVAWASAGLDTGTPGYTLANAVQPHNEGDFTTLGRVIKGMDVVDQFQQGDKITAARMLTQRP